MRENKSLLERLFGRNLKVVLERFDEWGSRIAAAGRCWGDGFQSGAVQAVFPSAQIVEK
jgi:hypothetical protein